ncbi:toxin-antitoxin system TumE family protein [Candidatus Regiella endosymbiont of Tuberolachnus salignus]|uniref:toxin-antitoxin system TumE family protein n=1 Tax=Candidatus Regiella endosymbiont of Tuberolachnus salignus TaxID=3077956 RepID=UPI0030D46A89
MDRITSHFYEHSFIEMVVWRVDPPVKASQHSYKYRLAYIEKGVCVLRYDNEAGKGDHKHIGSQESPIIFNDAAQLVSDFRAEVEKYRKGVIS